MGIEWNKRGWEIPRNGPVTGKSVNGDGPLPRWVIDGIPAGMTPQGYGDQKALSDGVTTTNPLVFSTIFWGHLVRSPTL